MFPFNMSLGEVNLLLEALEHRASRHESEARYRPRSAAAHDATAQAMRDLRLRLLKHKVETGK